MKKLRYQTPLAWAECVINDMDSFLPDHAAAEKKASGMAMSMLSHYPDRAELVTAMMDLAIEEMTHFREVVKIMMSRGLQLGADTRDAYVNNLRSTIRKGSDVYFLDRLLIAGIIEARGQERFGLIGEQLPAGDLKTFYRAISRSEAKHSTLFYDLAECYFTADVILPRYDELLDIEAEIIARQPLRPSLH